MAVYLYNQNINYFTVLHNVTVTFDVNDILKFVKIVFVAQRTGRKKLYQISPLAVVSAAERDNFTGKISLFHTKES